MSRVSCAVVPPAIEGYLSTFSLDSSHLPYLTEIISMMLHERSPLSVGCVVVAFEAVCPTQLDLVHKEYRRLCNMVVDLDEWGQFDLLNLLLRYARTMLHRPPVDGVEADMDVDLRLLLTKIEPLLMSRNPSVRVYVVLVSFYQSSAGCDCRGANYILRWTNCATPEDRSTNATPTSHVQRG